MKRLLQKMELKLLQKLVVVAVTVVDGCQCIPVIVGEDGMCLTVKEMSS